MAKSFYGLIGKPLTHSFSPAYFREKFERAQIEADYTAYTLNTIEDLPRLLKDHPELQGLNVTIPYKTAVIPYLQALSKEAEYIGAVNCITIRNGKLTGHNTDWLGFRDSLKPLLKSHHTQALLIGNGGAAKAVAYTLRQLGLKYRIVSRGNDSNSLSYKEITPGLLQEYTVLINTTPLGMYPDEDRAPELPYDHLTDRHLLYDLIYNPAETLFLKHGASRGAAIKNGLEMLERQAEASWDIWQGDFSGNTR